MTGRAVSPNRVIRTSAIGGLPIRLGIGFGSVWLRDDSGKVLRLQPLRCAGVTSSISTFGSLVVASGRRQKERTCCTQDVRSAAIRRL